MIIDRLETEYKKVFTDSLFTRHNWTNFLGNNKESYVIRLYLAKNEEESINRILDNDMFMISFDITRIDTDTWEIKALHNCYKTIPMEEWLYCSNKKIAFRKTIGNEQKIVDTFKKFIDRLHKQLLEDYKNGLIHENDLELFKLKLGVE